MAIDMAYLAVQTGGDRDLQRELLALFAAQLADADRRLPALTSGEAADLLHRLKGSARAIGATALGPALEQAEQRIGSDPAGIALRRELESLRGLLRTAAVEVASLIDA